MPALASLILAILFLQIPNVHAGLSEKEPEDDEYGLCGVAKRGFQEKIEKARQQLGRDLQLKPLLNNCAKALTSHLDNCTTPQRLTEFGCKSGSAQGGGGESQTGSASGKGIPQAADKMAAGFVDDANCKRRLSHCVSQGNNFHGRESNNQAWQKCLHGDKLSFSPVPNPQTPRDRDASARNQLLSEAYRAQQEYTKCLKDRAKSAEELAEKTLLDSIAARAHGATPAVNCINHDIGVRICEVSRDGQRISTADGQEEYQDARDPEADQHNPVHVEKSGSHCSGTLLGDGQTVVTAGHCLENGGRGSEQRISVRDSTGQEHTVTARCSGQFDGVGYSDIAKCSLPQPIKANPLYLATHDPQIQGAGCVDEGYIKRCGSGFFENLTNKPVTVYAYPADQGLTRSIGSITGTGTNGWIWKNGVLYHDLLCTGGCSGSGYIVNVDGQRVVVGASSFADRYRIGGGGTYPTYRQWQGLRVQSVSTEKLANGTLLFQRLQ